MHLHFRRQLPAPLPHDAPPVVSLAPLPISRPSAFEHLILHPAGTRLVILTSEASKNLVVSHSDEVPTYTHSAKNPQHPIVHRIAAYASHASIPPASGL